MEQISETLSQMWIDIIKVSPKIFGAIAILIIGWLVTKLVVYIIKKALTLAKADTIDDKINEIELFGDKKLNFNIIKFVSKLVKWLMYIIILVIISDFLNLRMISEQIGNLLNYIPKLLTALVIFTVGLLFANLVKKSLKSLFESMELSGSKFISQAVFFIILIFISITALNQAGVDTEIVTSNITLILSAFLVAFALAFGFGAREMVSNLLKAFYTRKTYEVGQVIKFDNVEGEIVSVNDISMTLKTASGTLIVPIKDIVDNQVEIRG